MDWTQPQFCLSCPKQLVPFGKGKLTKDLLPGTAFHSAKGLCYNCNRAKRDGYENRAPIVYDEEAGIICKLCEDTLPLNEFDLRPSGRRAPSCRQCASLRYYYHITKKQYNEMLEAQNHCCSICKRHESVIPAGLHIDHDHSCCPTKARSCGKCVRGLLCSRCNKGIGLLQDDPSIMQAAINYLESRS